MKRPKLASMAGASILCGSSLLAWPAPAQAATATCAPTPDTSHCYAVNLGEGNGSSPSAAGTDLEVDCLSVPNRSTDFADWEMWYATYTPQVSYDTWVEEGMTAGTLYHTLSGVPITGFMWFWADKRPNGSYTEHYIQSASVGNYTNASIYYVGGTDENVYLGGSYAGTSTANGTGGIEVISAK
jgi:hypothetical protein